MAGRQAAEEIWREFKYPGQSAWVFYGFLTKCQARVKFKAKVKVKIKVKCLKVPGTRAKVK